MRLDSGTLAASCVVLATGGRSVLAGGADAAGFDWAAALGHTVRPLFPALVPLTGSSPAHAALAGVSLEASVTAASGDGSVTARGGFLFTHRGWSGPAVLDVSHVVSRALAGGRPFSVTVVVRRRAARSGTRPSAPAPARSLGVLRRSLPDRVAALVLEEAGVAPDAPLHRLPREARREVVRALTALPLPVEGTEGYRTAEVTAGGVALEEVDPGSGASRLVPGLFLAGEILDAIGPIGGFNFQWAWATGRTAGEGAARGRSSRADRREPREPSPRVTPAELQPLTTNPRAARSGRTRSRTSPASSTAPGRTVPPTAHAFFSAFASSSRKGPLSGRASTTVTLLPPRPFFSIRSFAVTFAGTGSSSLFEQRQSSAGQPHVGQIRPFPLE